MLVPRGDAHVVSGYPNVRNGREQRGLGQYSGVTILLRFWVVDSFACRHVGRSARQPHGTGFGLAVDAAAPEGVPSFTEGVAAPEVVC